MVRGSEDLTGIDFAAAIKHVRKGEVVKPQLATFLHEAHFPDNYAVAFVKGDNNRPPDGWFWPSTHPLWSEKALYTWVTDPGAVPREERAYMNTLSLTMGSAVHGFIETCLEAMGLRPRDLNTCQMCPPREDGTVCREAGFMDSNAGSRGHMDGVLDLTGLVSFSRDLEETSGFEFKTLSSGRRLTQLENLGVSFYRETWPEYYAQNQEYLRLSGLRSMVVLFMLMGYPWTMVELHVPFDPVYSRAQEQKYLRVREAVAAETAPECCHSRGCVIKDLCGLAKARPKATQVLIQKGGNIGFHR